MKNTNSKYTEVIADYIKANPGATIDGIKEGNPKVSHVMVVKALKDLQAENLITVGDAGEYTFVSKKNAPTVEPKAATKADKKTEEEEGLGPKSYTGRDNTKYAFNGQDKLSKGRLVHAVIKKYTESNPKASLTKLEEVFDSKTIQPRFGVIAELSVAKGFSKNKVDRFFLKTEDILHVGMKKDKVAVCNQWSADTLKPFLKIAASLGMKIKAE